MGQGDHRADQRAREVSAADQCSGSETGPGSQLVTWGKSTILSVDAHGFKFEYTLNSAKHIPFDWVGPKAEPSPAAQRKAARKRTDPADGEPLPVHSFHSLLGDLATLTRNLVRLGRDRLTAILATPTQTQRRALDLLGLTPTA